MRDIVAWGLTFALLFSSFFIFVLSVERESYFLLYLGVVVFLIGAAIPISRMFGIGVNDEISTSKNEATE